MPDIEDIWDDEEDLSRFIIPREYRGQPHQLPTVTRADLTPPAADYVAGLEAALEWYSEQSRLCRIIHSGGDAGRHALQADGGNCANLAIAARPASPATEPPTLIDAEHSRMMRAARQDQPAADYVAGLIKAGDVMANALRGNYIVPGSAAAWHQALAARPASPDTRVVPSGHLEQWAAQIDTLDPYAAMSVQAEIRAIIAGGQDRG